MRAGRPGFEAVLATQYDTGAGFVIFMKRSGAAPSPT